MRTRSTLESYFGGWMSRRPVRSASLCSMLALGACAMEAEPAQMAPQELFRTGIELGRRLTNPNDIFVARLHGDEKLADARANTPVASPDATLLFDHFKANNTSKFRVTALSPPTDAYADEAQAADFMSTIVAEREPDGAPTYTEIVGVDGDTFVADSEHMTIGNDPRLPGGGSFIRTTAAPENCMRQAGPAGILVDPTGDHECRRFLVFMPGSDGVYVAQLGVLLRSHADGVRLTNPTIEDAKFVTAFAKLAELDRSIELTVTADSRLLFTRNVGARATGINFTFNPTPWSSSGWAPYRSVTCLHVETGSKCPGFEAQPSCAGATDATCGVADTKVVGVEFRRRYPIAQVHPRNFDGTDYPDVIQAQNITDLKIGTKFAGSYAWISADGADLFFNASERSVRSVYGKNTEGVLKHVDTQANVARERYCIHEIVNGQTIKTSRSVPVGDAGADCETFDGLRMAVGLGTSGGMWRPFPDAPDLPIPFSRRTPAYMMLENNNLLGNLWQEGDPTFNPVDQAPDGPTRHVYSEVPLDDFGDPAFAAVWHMNEALDPPGSDIPGSLDAGKTPDTSGNFYTGTLSGAVTFPFEMEDDDVPEQVNPGYLGRALHFASEGTVTAITNQGPLAVDQSKLTIELAIKPESGAGAVLELPSFFKLSLVASGDLLIPVVELYHGKNSASQTLSNAGLVSGEWSHLVVTLDLDGDRQVRAYVNGALKHTTAKYFANLTPDQAAKISRRAALPDPKVVLGPGEAPGVAYWLDEVAISTVVRDAEYIAGAAYATTNILSDFDVARSREEGPALLTNSGTLPAGLRADDLRIPKVVFEYVDGGVKDGESARKSFQRIEKLGGQLFVDSVLSTAANGLPTGATCSKCHGAAGDARTQALLLDNNPQSINTPLLVNRAFSTRQFFDRRSPSLVHQALKPIVDTNEMGGNLAEILKKLESKSSPSNDDSWRSRFEAAFALGVGEKISTEHVAVALAAFELGILKGNPSSPSADAVKGEALFRGKARCVACHSGANYSDERMHRVADDVAVKTPSLRGVFSSAVTGKRFHNKSVENDPGSVVDFYASGGGCVVGALETPCDPELHPFALSGVERDQLVEFLKSLSSP